MKKKLIAALIAILIAIGIGIIVTGESSSAKSRDDLTISRTMAYDTAKFVLNQDLSHSLKGGRANVKVESCHLDAQGKRWRCPSEVFNEKTYCSTVVEVWPASRTTLNYVFDRLRCGSR